LAAIGEAVAGIRLDAASVSRESKADASLSALFWHSAGSAR
jgi:hypothetical protein